MQAIRGVQAKRHRIRGLLTEVAIATAFVLGLVAWAWYVPEERWVSSKWIGFAALTAVVFGYPLNWFRREWSCKRFWMYLGILLLLHTSVGVAILCAFTRVPLMFFAAAGVPELWIVSRVLETVEEHSTKSGIA